MADLTDLDRVVLRLCNLLALDGDGINVTSKLNLIDRATAEGIGPGAVTHSLTCLEEYGLVAASANDGPTAPLMVTPAGFEEWASLGVDNFDAVVIVTAQWILADVRTSNAIAEKTNLHETLIRRVMGLLIDAEYCRGRHDVDGLTVFDCTERFTHQFDPERIVDLKRAEPGQFGRFG